MPMLFAALGSAMEAPSRSIASIKPARSNSFRWPMSLISSGAGKAMTLLRRSLYLGAGDAVEGGGEVGW